MASSITVADKGTGALSGPASVAITTVTNRWYVVATNARQLSGTVSDVTAPGVTFTSVGASNNSFAGSQYTANCWFGKCTAGASGNVVISGSGISGGYTIVEIDGALGGAAQYTFSNTSTTLTLSAFESGSLGLALTGSTSIQTDWTQLSASTSGIGAQYDTTGDNTWSNGLSTSSYFFEFAASAPTTVGPKDGALALTSGGSVSWANPSNGLTSDNAYTTHTTSTTAANMPYLNITGYDFSSIPNDATIKGITVTVERKYTGGTTGNVRDNTLQLMKAGTRVGSNYAATATNWGTTDTTINYGGTSDLWGTTWTPSEIKASNFGASFRAIGNGTSANRVANVDDISISVTYTGGTTVVTDPYWANVVAALHFNGTNGSTTMLDQTGRPWTASNGAALSTTTPIMGSASLALDGVNDYIASTDYLSDLMFGTGDFTLEIDFKTTVSGSYQILLDYVTSTSVPGFQLYLLPSGTGLGFYSGTSVNTECTTHEWNDGVWHQAVVTRSGTTQRIFLDGTLYSTTTNSVNFNVAAPALAIGRQNYDGNYYFNGKIDEVRITNGIARYTAGFTTSLTEFVHGDPSYVVLAGAINSTLGAATASVAGNSKSSGSIARTLGAATASMTGSVAPPPAGSINVTLGAATASLTGVVITPPVGAINVTLGAATATVVASSKASGSIASSLSPATASATGTVRSSAGIAATLGAATASVVASSRASGSIARTLGAATVNATGIVGNTPIGTINVTLGAATGTATGSAKASASIVAILGAATATFTGQVLTPVQPLPPRGGDDAWAAPSQRRTTDKRLEEFANEQAERRKQVVEAMYGKPPEVIAQAVAEEVAFVEEALPDYASILEAQAFFEEMLAQLHAMQNALIADAIARQEAIDREMEEVLIAIAKTRLGKNRFAIRLGR